MVGAFLFWALDGCVRNELFGTTPKSLLKARASAPNAPVGVSPDSYPLFFDNEAEAIGWFCEQQERTGVGAGGG